MDRVGETNSSGGRTRLGVLGSIALATAAIVAATVLGTAHATASPPQIAGSPAAPTASEADPECTTTNPAAVLGPQSGSLPSKPV